eukprot:TRINITY_DN20838_c0_g1_i1.p1 TRINITY_DN20838_c0_g1~~TRINITY_DN20838_c0_g1_i1.p1  ORF type:complete len:579 (+),score=190.18 TRINITY_DN20838_c0_g1_i1:46-1782(+)
MQPMAQRSLSRVSPGHSDYDDSEVCDPRTSYTPKAAKAHEAGGHCLHLKLFVMFVLGAAVALVGVHVASPAGLQTHPAATVEQLPADVANTLEFLGSLDMESYAPLVKERHMTISFLSSQNVGAPLRGFKPYHWRRLVMEARLIQDEVAQAAVADKEGPKSLPTLPFDDETKPSAGRGQAGDLEGADVDEPVVPKARPVVPAPVTAPQAAKPVKKDVKKDVSIPTLVPKAKLVAPVEGKKLTQWLPPPSDEKTICGSMHRSNLLRDLFYEWKGGERKPVPGMRPPAHCDGYTPEETTPSVTKEHTSDQHPTVAAGRERRFVKQALTADGVKMLRRSGVAEQLYLDHELKLLYCVVPKAGCTSFKAWLLNNAKLFKGGTVHDRSLYSGARVQNAQFVSDDVLMDALNGGEYFKFTVTRSPYTRSLATYLERFNKCEKQTRRTKGECDMWKRALVGPTGRTMPRDDMSYPEFLDVMKAAAVPEVDFRNAHWVSNVQVCGYDQLAYDWMGHLEDSKDSELLYAITGQPGFKKDKQSGLRHSEGTSSKIPHYYSPEAKRLIEEIFADTDVSKLGYVAEGVVP